MASLWTEKYRPQQIEDYVFSDSTTEQKIKEWINKKDFPHLLFYGPPGTGKSTLVGLLLKYCNITDFQRINASNKTGIDDTRDVIEYASIPPEDGSFKVIILEEMDRLSPQAQDSLKTVMEDYSEWCRFILTTNHVNKITTAMKSRCQDVEVKKLNIEQFSARILSILNSEGIAVNDVNIITQYVKTYYPDLRKCIGALEKNSVNNVLQSLSSSSYASEIFEKAMDFFKDHDIRKTRDLIAANLSNNDFENFYRYMYEHLEDITTDLNRQDMVVVKIAEYLYKNALVADMEINLIACLIELENVIK